MPTVDHLTYQAKLRISFTITAVVCVLDFALKIWAQNNLPAYNKYFFILSEPHSPFLTYTTNPNLTAGLPFNPLIVVGVIAIFLSTFIFAYHSRGLLPILACGLVWAIILANGLERILTGVGIDYLGFILPFNLGVVCIVNLADLAGLTGMLLLFFCTLRPTRFGALRF